MTPAERRRSSVSRSTSSRSSSGMALSVSVARSSRSLRIIRRSPSSRLAMAMQVNATRISSAAVAMPRLPGMGASAAQLLLDAGAYGGHVGAAGGFRLHHAHDLAHVLDRGGARRGDGFGDERIQFGLRQLGGK